MSLTVVNLSSQDYTKFKGFLNLTESSLETGIIPNSKKIKIKFLETYILPNRNLFKFKGAQLCTTRIGEHLGVKAQTVMNWIKCLIRNRCLIVSNSYWSKGFTSKHYVVNQDNEAFVDVLNQYNGYGVTIERVSHNKQLKYEFRKKAWERFDFCTPTRKSITFLASTYLGCPEQFRDDLVRRLPIDFLKSPALSNAYRPMFYEFFRALKFVTNDRNNKMNSDHIPRPYRFFKTFEEFIGELDIPQSYNRSGNDVVQDRNISKHVRGVLINLNAKLLKANGRKKKRLKEFKKAYNWLVDYITDDSYEDYKEFAPYHSLEKLK